MQLPEVVNAAAAVVNDRVLMAPLVPLATTVTAFEGKEAKQASMIAWLSAFVRSPHCKTTAIAIMKRVAILVIFPTADLSHQAYRPLDSAVFMTRIRGTPPGAGFFVD